MSGNLPSNVIAQLQEFGQEHLLKWWNELNNSEREQLSAQLDSLDLPALDRLIRQARAAFEKTETPDAADAPAAKARRAAPPSNIVRLPDSPHSERQWQQAAASGEQLLAAGKVGVLLVAGGQGTRLRFDHAKGMFPIGPVSRKSLFQMFCEHLLARSRKSNSSIPLYVMTSDATHRETVDFFGQHRRFGLPERDVHFFKQGNMPSVDARTGRLLMDEQWRIVAGPDGHGGMVAALQKSGLLDDMARRGIELLFYLQVDNPLARVCDPAFLGLHQLHGSQLSTKVVSKRNAADRMGVLVDLDDKTQIIEYSDLPADMAAQCDKTGQLRLWAGNTGMHVFDRSFLEQLAGDEDQLPFHIAHKAVRHLDDSGTLVEPHQPNAFKFERFIFDALPLARAALVVEANRDEEFSPVKNETGDDSPQTSEASLVQLHAGWLKAAGANVAADAVVEISPLFAQSMQELLTRIAGGLNVTGQRYFE